MTSRFAHQPVPPSDRGAILVQTALVLLALLAFSAFAVDYGVLWASRRQSQNAADAAALAGAVAFAFDSSDITTSGPAYESAQRVASEHRVWGQVPAADITLGATACPAGVSGICVRVDVYRNAAHGNALPTFFGTLVGITSQDIQATATAQVAVANATDCLKPWAVIDKWNEHYPINPGVWTQTSSYDKYQTSGPSKGELDPTILTPDEYIPPTSTSVGSGLHPYDYTPDRTYSTEYGMEINLKVGSQNDFQYTAGWFAPIAFPGSSGGADYRTAIGSCIGLTYSIGDELPMDTEPGAKTGPTQQGVSDLIAQDPGATWDTTLNDGHGGVANSAFPISPLIVPVALVNPDQLNLWNKGGRATVAISNIMGFFVEGYDSSSKSVTGRLCALPGMKVGSATPISAPSGFLQAILLIR
jgi:Flp pilus assembly protein TadG